MSLALKDIRLVFYITVFSMVSKLLIVVLHVAQYMARTASMNAASTKVGGGCEAFSSGPARSQVIV